MENFARNHLQSKYGFADPTELHLAIKASCDAGEMIDSGYILWYIKPELQGESNQNVDDPSDRPAVVTMDDRSRRPRSSQSFVLSGVDPIRD